MRRLWKGAGAYMKELEIFFLSDCPYCFNARKALRELMDEQPAYASVIVRWIEERANPEAAKSMDYYYVPSVFYRGKKLYEARPGQGYAEIKANLGNALERVISER